MKTTDVIAGLVIGLIIGAGVIYVAVPPKEITKEVPPKEVTIELWEAWAGEPSEAALKAIAASFSKAHPYIEVKVTGYTGAEYWTKVRSAMAAGEPPDMYVTYGGGELIAYVRDNQAIDITSLLREDWAKKLLAEDALAVAKLGDKLYGMPYEMNMIWLFVNVDLFKKAGIPIPENGWTWDEFKSAITKLKAAGITPLGIGAKDAWDQGWWWCTLVDRIGGKDAYYNARDRKASFTDAPFVEAYKKIGELMDMKPCQAGFETASAFSVWGMFGRGDVAMYYGGSWAAGYLETFAGLNYTTVPFPYIPGGKGDPRATHILPNAIAVSPTGAKHKEQVFEWLRYLSSEVALTYFVSAGKSPMAAAVTLPAGIYPDRITKAIARTRASPSFVLAYGTMSPPELGKLFSDTHVAIMLGKITPEAACKAFEDLAKDLATKGILPYK